jgi:hypothetical protein
MVELISAIVRACSCRFGPRGTVLYRCPAHELLRDQRTLDRLLFARRIRERLLHEELTPDPDSGRFDWSTPVAI